MARRRAAAQRLLAADHCDVLDRRPRPLTQVWPIPSLPERQEARAKSVADGNWPPKGGPDWLSPEMYSAIALPLPFSPLR